MNNHDLNHEMMNFGAQTYWSSILSRGWLGQEFVILRIVLDAVCGKETLSAFVNVGM